MQSCQSMVMIKVLIQMQSQQDSPFSCSTSAERVVSSSCTVYVFRFNNKWYMCANWYFNFLQAKGKMQCVFTTSVLDKSLILQFKNQIIKAWNTNKLRNRLEIFKAIMFIDCNIQAQLNFQPTRITMESGMGGGSHFIVFIIARTLSWTFPVTPEYLFSTLTQKVSYHKLLLWGEVLPTLLSW